MNISAAKGRVKAFFTAKNVALLGVLLSLVIVLQALGGSISFGAVTLNFTLVPIVLSALLLGAVGGALTGFACGVVVLIQVVIAPSGFYAVIWQYAPFVTILTCLLKTTVAGGVAGLIFEALEKKNRYAAVFVASGTVPVVNTALFVLGCLCMSDAISAFQSEAQIGGMNVFVCILVVLVTFNFFIELAVNLLVAPALHTVCRAAEKRLKK